VVKQTGDSAMLDWIRPRQTAVPVAAYRSV
jgi:hypothetical protein